MSSEDQTLLNSYAGIISRVILQKLFSKRLKKKFSQPTLYLDKNTEYQRFPDNP
ncbi:MAG: hypothetical protein QNJ31_04665 [Candidatus Caenarcaniphilales bacterium]|nr:hypothetical protein [Candidatus Caenarcaniphilales bacterium]